MDQLLQWDRDLFALLNGWHSPLFDTLMSLFSERWFWIPLYVILLWQIWKREGWPGLIGPLLAIAILISLVDQSASSLLKPWVGRLRPCRPEAGLSGVHLVDGHCGGLYGFVSSHAANFFALATFLSLYLQRKAWTWILFPIAVLVAYSRIYLGVHYPGDVIAGAALGLMMGWLIWKGFSYLKTKRLYREHIKNQ